MPRPLSHPRSVFVFTKALTLIFLIMLSTMAQAQSPRKDPGNTETVVDNGDLLYVIIPKEVTSEFSPTERNYFKEKVEVDRHGYIFMPSQGNIKISGLTTGQISDLLTNNLPKYLSKSDRASVNLIEKRHYIQILGHVAMPGWYNIPESANIQAMLSQAGGILDGADLSKVSISRTKDGRTEKIAADIQRYLLKGDTKILPQLHENDTVFVPLMVTSKKLKGMQPARTTSGIRIFGAVNSPGIYPAAKGMNLLDLLITAHGEAADADLSNIKIMRAGGARDVFDMQALLDADTTGTPASFPKIKKGDIVHISRKPLVALDGRGNAIAAAPQSITMTGPGSNAKGLRPFYQPMTPLQAITQGGGVNDFADTEDIFIIRRVGGKQKNLPYNYDKALKGEAPDVDFQLRPGDIIFIP